MQFLATRRGLLFEVDNCPLYKERHEISEILNIPSQTHSLYFYKLLRVFSFDVFIRCNHSLDNSVSHLVHMYLKRPFQSGNI